jgi:SAM-dependent methyltransferase
MTQIVFDTSDARELDALYQTRDAVRRRRIVRQALGAAAEERVLDVGCGPGFYCEELAREVGPSGLVVGVDSSAPMLALAERRCAQHANVELRQAEAGSLPADDGVFDGALCVQVLEYVADATAALAEIWRVLRPGGRVVVWDVDWATLSIHSHDLARTGQVLRAWDQHLTHRSLPRTLAPRLRSAGFADVEGHGHVFSTVAFDPDTYGGAVVPNIAAFVVGRGATLMGRGPVTEDDARAWVDELRQLDARGAFYFAVSQFCFTAIKPR